MAHRWTQIINEKGYGDHCSQRPRRGNGGLFVPKPFADLSEVLEANPHRGTFGSLQVYISEISQRVCLRSLEAERGSASSHTSGIYPSQLELSDERLWSGFAWLQDRREPSGRARSKARHTLVLRIEVTSDYQSLSLSFVH